MDQEHPKEVLRGGQVSRLPLIPYGSRCSFAPVRPLYPIIIPAPPAYTGEKEVKHYVIINSSKEMENKRLKITIASGRYLQANATRSSSCMPVSR